MLLAAFAGGCTINIVPPGAPQQPPPAPPPPASSTEPPRRPQPAQAHNTHDCEDLQRSGMDFNQVVQYWYGLGSPSDMDDDSDGIPCETIYGEKNVSSATQGGTHDCATLQARGMSFIDVTGYWYSLGSPSDMDDDSDGIPCETIYGER
ncbi:hypothetical protein FHU35_17235 [Saccharopolyspora dendranthemae]|uniref:Excalibur calcium-binding domain-containing protein n=1 Tax=Saccharopolyspora dendranthemae TaxID=1181886 RepID=A0A561TZT4_9PSEU|nr:hypothetical protein FHU35_17235 [Saccharopolyspora dendranthemae]